MHRHNQRHQPRRLLFCTDSLESGGIERQLTELVTRLDRAHFAPRVLALYGDRAGKALHFAPALQAANVPLTLLDLGWRASDKARGLIGIARAVWQFRPSVLQAMNYHSNLLCRAVRPILPPRLKLIGSVRGNYSTRQLTYERLTWRLCAKIVVNSPALAQQLIDQAHIPAAKIVHIANGVDTARLATAVDPGFRQHIAPGARRVLVSLGRISAEKQMHWLAQAFGVLKQTDRLPGGTRLFIVGSAAQPEAVARLEQAIQADDLAAVVTRCPDTDTPEKYYQAADATVLFSPAEGLPNVVLESLAAGRPVVISAAANAAGVIDHGRTGWIVPTGDIGALAATLNQVLTLSDAELAAFRAACLARAQDYTLATMIARYSDLYA